MAENGDAGLWERSSGSLGSTILPLPQPTPFPVLTGQKRAAFVIFT